MAEYVKTGNRGTPFFAAIEAGGTKFNCAVFSADGEVISWVRIATGNAEETLSKSLGFFSEQSRLHGPLIAAGIASFGPLDLDPLSAGYGCIVSTPKPGWSGVNILEAFREGLGVRTGLDTDVNCAALAEGRLGAARGCGVYCYMTVGTGIGVGVIRDDQPIGGSGHPELGHIRVPRAPGDRFEGSCPYHQDCVEGLACGPAMAARWGAAPETLPVDHPAWEIEAHYIACLCQNLTYTVRPQKIVIGGGVFAREHLYNLVRVQLSNMLGGYALSAPERDLKSYISPPGLAKVPPGLLGALEIARDAAGSQYGEHHGR